MVMKMGETHRKCDRCGERYIKFYPKSRMSRVCEDCREVMIKERQDKAIETRRNNESVKRLVPIEVDLNV